MFMKKISALGLAAMLVVAVSACGDSSDAAGPDDPTVRILTLPIVDNAAAFYGMDHGIFEEYGVRLETATTAGGNAGIPAMLGGSTDIVMAGGFPAIQAAEKGLPVRILAASSTSLTEEESPEDYVEIVAGPDADITSPDELAGKTMAVNVRGGTNEIYTLAFLEKHGVDPSTVKLVALPFPDMPAALLAGRIDATMIGAPFLQTLKAEGAKTLGYPYRVQENPANPGTYVTTDKFAEENPETLEKLIAALDKVVEEMNKPENREAVLESLSKHTQISVDELESVTFPNFEPGINMAGLRETVQLGQKYGLLGDSPDLEKLVVNQK